MSKSAEGTGHRWSFLLALAVAIAPFVRLACAGRVILSDDIARTASVAEPAPRDRRPFRDHSSVYIPELEHQLAPGPRSWIATWNPHVELGRPAWQVSGLSKAFLPTHVLSWFVRDPFVLYTCLAALAAALSVTFGYLFLRSLALSPAACGFGALVLALGFYSAYWMTYVLYLWGTCWTLALLWLVPSFVSRPRAWTGLGVAGALHALLLSAYPQQVVWSVALIALWSGVCMARSGTPVRTRLRAAGAAVLVLGLGAASVVPVFADLALAAEQSVRPTVDLEFFAEALPGIASAKDLATWATRVFDAHWFGNPLSPQYPVEVRGVSWTPVVCALLALSLAHGKRHWPWLAFTALTVAMTVWAPLYFFGVEHLLLGMSRHTPMSAAHVPVAVLAALGAERVLGGGASRWRALAVALAPALLALPGCLVAWDALDGAGVAVGLLLLAGTLAFVWTRSRLVLLALGTATVVAGLVRLELSHPLAETRPRSALVERIRTETADGSRYAWFGLEYGGSLHPNQEALFGLRSVHSNNSLSSRRYQAWMRRVWGVESATHGRLFVRLPPGTEPDLSALSWAGVSLLLSWGPLPAWLAHEVGRVEPLRLYGLGMPARLEAQLTKFSLSSPGNASVGGSLGSAAVLPVQRTLDASDALAFRTTAAPSATLLFVSQQHHPHWQATSGGARLETVVVDDFYQGVVVPPGTELVELAFRPWVRWSWVPQVALAAAALALLLRSAITRVLADRLQRGRTGT